MPMVKNINSLQYFLNRFPTIDSGYDYTVDYHTKAKNKFTSLPTFVAEFFDCRVNSCPVLVTNDGHMITQFVWNITHRNKHKPHKTHGLWKTWGDEIDLTLPSVTKQFNETYTYVWLPIDEQSAENPWHVWIDMISKFRLIEKRWSNNFSKYVFILSNPSSYFDKVQKEFFPELKYMVLPKKETWQFKHLIVPSLSNHDDGVLTPALAPWMRTLKKTLNLNENRKRKIFISRDDAGSRKLLNAEKLMMALKGWETITLDGMPIKEQVRCFSEASHVVTTHGAGLVNLLWCDDGTKVIEIQDIKKIDKKVYPVLSYHLNLRHKIHVAKTIPINLLGAKPTGTKKWQMINFEINIPKLIQQLD
jgi:hypothetical protein